MRKTISVSIDTALAERLKTLNKETFVPTSRTVEVAVKHYLEEKDGIKDSA